MPVVDFVALDPQGIITREQWTATRLHCPRCGRGAGAVWALTSEPPFKVGQIVSPVYLCIGCRHTAIGLNGYQPQWDQGERVRQIIKYGFDSEEATRPDPPKSPKVSR